MSKYVYPAVFTPAEEGGYLVNFPDLPGCFTDGDTVAEAIEMANDVLCLWLLMFEKNETPIPPATPLTEITTEKDSFVTLIMCETDDYPMTEYDKDGNITAEWNGGVHSTADTVKQTRLGLGLTQKAFSERLNIPKRTIENWEGGKSEPPAYVLTLLEYYAAHELK